MMAGGPEFGNQGGNVSSCVGSYMYSAVVFSDVSVKEKLSGETFANVDRARWTKLHLLPRNHASSPSTDTPNRCVLHSRQMSMQISAQGYSLAASVAADGGGAATTEGQMDP